jgi:hypothetical protein
MLSVHCVGFRIVTMWPLIILTSGPPLRVSFNLITASGRQVLGECRTDHAAENRPGAAAPAFAVPGRALQAISWIRQIGNWGH